MKFTWMLIAMALTVGAAQFVAANETSDQKRAQHDQLHIAAQGICPVTGQKLGAHGTPIKVTVGTQKEEVFLCCKGCLKQKIDPQHWKTIHTHFARAQKICPIMKKSLPAHPKWTIIEGQIVFVCCPPCTKKVAADPATYLPQIDELYAKSLQQQQ